MATLLETINDPADLRRLPRTQLGTLADELQYLVRLRQVTTAQIQAAARKYFRDDNDARVRLLPAGAR